MCKYHKYHYIVLRKTSPGPRKFLEEPEGWTHAPLKESLETERKAYGVIYDYLHGLINYKDTKTKCKCRHLKNLTCKGTLRQVFIRVYRLEIQSVMLVFSTQLCELLPI